jgi:hypothetical protein
MSNIQHGSLNVEGKAGWRFFWIARKDAPVILSAVKDLAFYNRNT